MPNVIIIAEHAQEVMFTVRVALVLYSFIMVFAFQFALMQSQTITVNYLTRHAMLVPQTVINAQVQQDAQTVKW